MKKPPQDLSQLIHQQGQLPSIAEKAELLLHLDHYVKQMITGPVTEQLKVANFRSGTLIIETTTAAWAARINFQKPKQKQNITKTHRRDDETFLLHTNTYTFKDTYTQTEGHTYRHTDAREQRDST